MNAAQLGKVTVGASQFGSALGLVGVRSDRAFTQLSEHPDGVDLGTYIFENDSDIIRFAQKTAVHHDKPRIVDVPVEHANPKPLAPPNLGEDHYYDPHIKLHIIDDIIFSALSHEPLPPLPARFQGVEFRDYLWGVFLDAKAAHDLADLLLHVISHPDSPENDSHWIRFEEKYPSRLLLSKLEPWMINSGAKCDRMLNIEDAVIHPSLALISDPDAKALVRALIFDSNRRADLMDFNSHDVNPELYYKADSLFEKLGLTDPASFEKLTAEDIAAKFLTGALRRGHY